jgi:hypothetical protein
MQGSEGSGAVPTIISRLICTPFKTYTARRLLRTSNASHQRCAQHHGRCAEHQEPGHDGQAVTYAYISGSSTISLNLCGKGGRGGHEQTTWSCRPTTSQPRAPADPVAYDTDYQACI